MDFLLRRRADSSKYRVESCILLLSNRMHVPSHNSIGDFGYDRGVGLLHVWPVVERRHFERF